MKGIHVNSTAPYVPFLGRVKNGDDYYVEDFELLTTILSAATWRRYNGPIKLYTDRFGEAYYARIGLTELWDAGIDTSVLESIDRSINYNVFWTVGRVAALRAEAVPFCSLDTDLIVWNSLSGLITSEFMMLHSEPLNHGVYQPREELQTPPDYTWGDWDWHIIPCNAGLMYFASDSLTNLFNREAMEFIIGNRIQDERVSRLPVHDVFVAQRLLPMCAQKLGMAPRCFLEWFRPERNSETMAKGGANRLVTHVWAYKDTLKKDPREREKFCHRCAHRLRSDYGEFAAIARCVPNLRRFFC